MQEKMNHCEENDDDDKRICKEIFDEITDFVILGLAFEIHRSLKLGYFFFDSNYVLPSSGVKGDNGAKKLTCPKCGLQVKPSFVGHLAWCMGLKKPTTRNTNRQIGSYSEISNSKSDQPRRKMLKRKIVRGPIQDTDYLDF